jgi:hypothetical protein
MKATKTVREPRSRELALDALEDELAELSAHINAATARWLDELGEFERRGGASFDGCERWLAWRCGVSPAEAREYVRVARALEELPAIRAVFARGELTYTKVRALTRVATPECEERLLELAGALTASQLERALRVYRRVTAAEARDSHAFEYVSYYWAEDGSLVLEARLPAEDGTLMVQALEAARERIRERRTEPCPPTDTGADAGEVAPEPSVRAARSFEPPRSPKVEALVDLAHASLSGPTGDRSDRERSRVAVHVDAAALANDAPGRCELESGPAISTETARRLGCDASTVTITESAGLPLSVGRKRRSVPPALRRALEARDDSSCQWPGCTNRRYLDAHHRRHWAHGGETSLDNLILLCWQHHRLVHEGGYTIEPDRDLGVRFRNRHGVVVPSAPRSPPGSAHALIEQSRHAGLTITANTNRNGTGERMDLALAVDALASIIG